MAMTPEQLNALTLGELEAIAARFGAAVRTIREAQSLLGGAPVVAPAQSPEPVSTVAWTAAELAERERLRRLRMAEMPSEIRRAEDA